MSDPQEPSSILNISAYRFVRLKLDQLPTLRVRMKEYANQQKLKGTILLSEEGINLFIAGSLESISEFQKFLEQFDEFKSLNYRQTWSQFPPFKRLLVRIKKEIITMGQSHIQPENSQAQYVEPDQLKQWYQQGKKMLILDTRNDYEIDYGTFVGALNLKIKNFRHFPSAIKNLPSDAKKNPVVTFCTGGIRCEKAALWLENQGFEQVYQLRGGILNYFEQCGRDFFQGDCFVFDERIVV